jgi:CelD/BcsL family acetyltransferase involved in cellulose biosynthesis
MKISVISVAELDASAISAWHRLQQGNPALASPYFSAEFTQAVAAVRPELRIAVIESDHVVAGLFPFENSGGRGQAVGAPLSDHHGIVCAPGAHFDWKSLLHATGLSYWTFDHLPRDQAPPGVAVTHSLSPSLDLSRGFTAWKQGRIAAGIGSMTQLDRKSRKLAREFGPLRLESHAGDRAVFDAVLKGKSMQCQRTGAHDFFAGRWARELVERVWQTQSESFGGRLSALYAGDTLVAAHMGMRSATTWHWWFPVYDHAFSKHSPGALLLMQVAQAAADQGHTLLDLGKGDDAYKNHFADGGLPLVEGWVKRPALATALQGARRQARAWWRESDLVRPMRRNLFPWLRRAGAVASKIPP